MVAGHRAQRLSHLAATEAIPARCLQRHHFDEELHSVETEVLSPELALLRKETKQTVRQAVEALPVDLREVVVLRELEGLSYKEIAAVAGIPMGTVMSRLSRARERLQKQLGDGPNKEP